MLLKTVLEIHLSSYPLIHELEMSLHLLLGEFILESCVSYNFIVEEIQAYFEKIYIYTFKASGCSYFD